MSADMVSALINAATNARDKALISCYATTGLRFNELTSITLEQYEQMRKDGTNKIAMTGKGGKEFFVFFSDANIAAIEQYLQNIHQNHHRYAACTFHPVPKMNHSYLQLLL